MSKPKQASINRLFAASRLQKPKPLPIAQLAKKTRRKQSHYLVAGVMSTLGRIERLADVRI